MNTPTDHQPYQPGGPVWPPQPTGFIEVAAPPAPRRRSRTLLLIAAIVANLIILGGGILLGRMLTGDDSTPAPAKPASAWDREQAVAPSVEDETLPDPAPTTAGPELHAEDVELTLKAVRKKCFGSAGCNVTVKIEAGYTPGLSEDDTWLVTYEIRGDEDGPVIGSFEVTGDTYAQNEETLSTPSKNTKLKVKVTDVEKVGV